MSEIKAEQLTHMCFLTSDLQGMEDWYGKMFGWSPHRRFKTPPELTRHRTKGERDTASVVIGELGGVPLEIGQYDPVEPPRRGLSHIGIRVADVDAAFEHAVAMGATIELEPFEAAPGLRIFFVRDPDGNQIEIGNLGDLTAQPPK